MTSAVAARTRLDEASVDRRPEGQEQIGIWESLVARASDHPRTVRRRSAAHTRRLDGELFSGASSIRAPDLIVRDLDHHPPVKSPAVATIWRSGSSIERERILMPMAWS
jgi:hypothetical protein